MSQPSRVLIHPFVDFMLVGGLSIVTLIVFTVLTDVYHFKMTDAPTWAYIAAFFVNYPHFAYSYQLFYKSFWDRLSGQEETLIGKVRMVIAGLAVPVLMVGYFVWAFRGFHEEYLGYAVLIMQFTVGWHYVKQGYGALITHSVYKGIFYSTWQKRILYINAYVLWLFSVINMSWFFHLLTNKNRLLNQAYYDVPYTIPYFPPGWHLPMMLLTVITSIMAFFVILKVWLREKKGISVNGVTAYLCTLYIWVLIPYIHGAFFFFIPFFHSLQYLPFVFKYKKSEFIDENSKGGVFSANAKTWTMVIGFLLGGFVLGGVFMDWGPKWLDKSHDPWVLGFSDNAYLVSFLIFINIHHYFIDSAFWRRDNAKAQKYLFKS